MGTSGGTAGGRERIVIVDELLPRRLKRAARRHVLRRPQLWRSVLLVSLTSLLVMTVPAFDDRDAVALRATLVGFPVALAVAVAAVMGSTMLSIDKQIDTEFVPGRLLGLTVGSSTIRYRDHDSCVEYAYSCVRGVEKIGNVAVIGVGNGFWVVPMELLDGVSLEVIRTRAGRPVLHADAWPHSVG